MKADLRTARRSNALMRAASSDFLLREQFVTDPASVFADYVRGTTLAAATAEAVNQLVYAMVSNPAMLRWLRDLSDADDEELRDDALASGLVKAVSASKDEALVSALLTFGADRKTTIASAFDVIRGIALGLRGVAGGAGEPVTTGTEFTPGTGTEFTPGTGTEFTPGTRTGTEFTPGTGTEFTPGTGTEFTPGTGTEFTPGTRTGTEFTPGTGTEFTPGTGTEFTPGTGTEFTPGLLGRFGDFQVIFQSLVAHANQLRRAGALSRTGFA